MDLKDSAIQGGETPSESSAWPVQSHSPPVQAAPGSSIRDRDVQQLYFVYVTSSREDWKYILESKGLGRHADKFRCEEPLHGNQFHQLDLPDVGMDLEATIHEFEGIPAHIKIEEFVEVLDSMMTTWDGFRRVCSKSHAHAELTAKLAMVTELLSTTSTTSSAKGFLANMQMTEANAVYASVDRGSVNPAIETSLVRDDGSVVRSRPSKRPFRALAAYNGPVVVAVLEERQGFVAMHQPLYVDARHHQQIASSYAKGIVYDSLTSKVVFEAVEKCGSFSRLLELLLSAGVDLAPLGGPTADSSTSPSKLGGSIRGTTGNRRCFRILQGVLVVGCMWDQPGTMSCLRWQPSLGDFDQPWGTVCIYRDDNTDVYLKCWNLYQKSNSLQEMRDSMAEIGFFTRPVTYGALYLPHL